MPISLHDCPSNRQLHNKANCIFYIRISFFQQVMLLSDVNYHITHTISFTLIVHFIISLCWPLNEARHLLDHRIVISFEDYRREINIVCVKDIA